MGERRWQSEEGALLRAALPWDAREGQDGSPGNSSWMRGIDCSALEQRGCGVFLTGDIPDLAGHDRVR